jgi:hypothetical protein
MRILIIVPCGNPFHAPSLHYRPLPSLITLPCVCCCYCNNLGNLHYHRGVAVVLSDALSSFL